MQETYSAIISSPFGKLGIKTNFETITHIDFLAQTVEPLSPQNSLAKNIVTQLNHYFENPNFSFNLNLQPEGTPFQLSVWDLLKTIPIGTTWTYGSLAEKLNTSSRAVGNACRNNPIPIIIPCHRIISAQNLGGYAGKTNGELIEIKKWLLKHEGVNL